MSLGLLLLTFGLAAAPGRDNCQECHAALDGRLAAPAQAYARDVHRRAGFTCASCHGGDAQETDPGLAMSKQRGFLGAIARTAIPKLCARCHSDAALMHKYRPQQRVDQLAQYLTSVHGQRLMKGDTAVATCSDCHGAHGISEVKDPQSPVHPLRLPQTCAGCHADAQHMRPYGLPTDQFEQYRQSVHWEALARRRDPSAPSCAACHGNHGATPPEVNSMAAVCGTCHALVEDLYRQSPHRAAFEAGGRGGCTVCHGHHRVLRASPEMLAGEKAICAQCHESGSKGAAVANEMAGLLAKLRDALARAQGILNRAARDGMEVSEATLRLQDGQEALVKARVAVHTVRLENVASLVHEGLSIADQSYRAGEQALRERDRRRLGLLVSLVTVSVAIAGLWMKLRAIESGGKQT